MKTKTMLSIFTFIAALVASNLAPAQDASIANPDGYFVQLNNPNAIYGNSKNKHLGDLQCSWSSAGSETSFHVNCSSATAKLSLDDVISPGSSSPAQFVDLTNGVKAQLSCNPEESSSFGYSCK